MPNEPTGLEREGLVAKHFRHTLYLWVALFATLNIVLFLGVWLVRDTITRSNFMLIPAVWLLGLYFCFTAYSVYIMLATDIGPETKKSGKLLWWHGAGWVIAMSVSAVLGLAFLFAQELAG